MVTLSLFVMCGILAFAVDFGWAFFVKRAAQRAADTAAMGAALHALSAVGPGGPYTCGTNMICQSATPCPATPSGSGNNIDVGCAYAYQNGFRTGGSGNRQLVTIESAVTPAGCVSASPPSCIPTAPGVAAYYYVTVRVSETIPQLFSAVLGHPTAEVASRATAAVLDSVINASLVLLNREADVSPVTGTGTNLSSQGGAEIRVEGGILMSSQCYGPNCSGNYAGILQGGTALRTPYTFIRGTGQACAGNLGCGSGSSWIETPISGKPTGDRMFLDPMRGRGQPPLTTVPQQSYAFDGGFIPGGTEASPTLLPPGNYYATETRGRNVVASGAAITLGSGYFRMGSCGNGVQDFVFFGGLKTGSGSVNVMFTPGRYVFAGQTGRPSDPLFEISNQTILRDCTASTGPNTDAGEIFIFTDAYYPGLDIQVPTMVQAIRGNLAFGTSGIKTGHNTQSEVNLHGLNKTNADVQSAGLEQFAPIIFWQDQRNSNVQYDANGNIVISCGSLDRPCTNSPSLSREMFLNATPDLHLYGAAYQPRGTWLNLQGGGSYAGNLQVITGAVNLQGSPPLTLTGPSNPITIRVASLVE